MVLQDKITRHVCPRNCYDTCGILASVRNGRIIDVQGDPKHGYTRGKLCAKGYCYIRRVYSPERINQPLRQLGRGTGRWQEISWDEALNIVCEKILTIKDRYGSTLPICLNKYSGNFGLMNFALEGLFNSLGPTTQVLGSPCWSAGLDAQMFDFGANINSDPEQLERSKLIILWGVNPAWTAVHSLPYIFAAQKNGAKVITIDPYFSETAKKGDWYIQIKPGQDGSLALALAKIILENGEADIGFLEKHTSGWNLFKEYLGSLHLEELSENCGVQKHVLMELADLISSSPPVFIWAGFGMQRYVNGGQNVRAIDALGAITGNIGRSGGGVHYASLSTWKLFNYNFLNSSYKNRFLNINNFAHEISGAQSPPVKMLWIANRNLFRQDADQKELVRALKDIELVITIDQFHNETTYYSDIILPTTTFFEEMDIVPGYWHHWIALNEQAISPIAEARSDLEIAKSVSGKLNNLRAGTCSFPEEMDEKYFLDREFSPETYDILGIDHWSLLENGPVKADIPTVSWENKKFNTPSGKFEFYSETAENIRLPALPILKQPSRCGEKYQLRLLNPHSQHCINSQFRNIDWLQTIKQESRIYIHPITANMKNIKNGDSVKIFNDNGEFFIKAYLAEATPKDTIIVLQEPGDMTQNLNKLFQGVTTDMGNKCTGNPGLAIGENFVDISIS